jgi:hypothetical protein
MEELLLSATECTQGDVWHIEIDTPEPLVPEPYPSKVKIAIAKLKMYKLPGIHQIPAELFQAGGERLFSVINKLINSIWNKEELPEQCKEPIIVPIYRKGDKTDCSNHQLHTNCYPISFHRDPRPYIVEITGDHQCGLRCNRSTNDHIFCICQILEKTGENNKTRVLYSGI